jgi:hypothetical protein
MDDLRETDLYAPVKAFLTARGYEVKAEIGAADVVALRDGAPPLIVEMKRAFSLSLVYQGLARLALTDHVYLAIPWKRERRGAGRDRVSLCRRLGLGLLRVRLSDGWVEVACDPGPYAPRKAPRRTARLLGEYHRLEGDPNLGGSRGARVTAYRQEALRCAAHLAGAGPCRGAEVAAATGVTRATRIMADNHYGWFLRVDRGIYALADAGRAAVSP